jgi:hypothetical protein
MGLDESAVRLGLQAGQYEFKWRNSRFQERRQIADGNGRLTSED